MMAWDGVFWWSVVILVGACVGSFLNVVIYRVPRGLSVNQPKRSYCPGCEKPIPWFRNLPLVTWLWQRGKCAECGMRIPFRYFLVELLTVALWALAWKLVGAAGYPGEAFLLIVFLTLLIAISFIDAEHYIIPVLMTWVGSAIAIAGAVFFPELVTLAKGIRVWPQGWQEALLGFAAGYAILQLVVWGGKLAFGRQRFTYDKPVAWHLREPLDEEALETPEGQLCFVVEGEPYTWGEMFYRPTDKLLVTGGDFLVDGKEVAGESLVIREDRVEIGSETYLIEDLFSLSGMTTEVVRPREAMGGGDPPLLAMIGAFLGWPAVLFTLFCSSLYALVAALLLRVGLGKPLPFGPFLALAGLTWAFGGWQLWEWYLGLMSFGRS
ncbi:prepilin peptidase [Roseibacillus ishigakijimensis]|uniref:Prepilin peptidase n=1 Tax=Roseibacillus ishigakijimensis TaxID=454146 RepID=A0A934RQT5_9BACT|nr:A24 family peptidase [Roseibacillus ishigakijimensis]MBK1833379.1 prepilin peptidase [Roseibacillus ishigakijimensis]